MRPLVSIAVLLSLGFAPAPFPKTQPGNADVNRAELRRLQGVWEVIQYRRGKLVRTDTGLRITISGSRMTWSFDGNVCSEWTVTLDAEASPKVILQVAVPKDSRLPMDVVYQLRGDQLLLCSPLDGLQTRATSLTPQRGYALYVLRRVRP
jgi:uncharacterized protein (TIGR03067 family)